MINLTVILTAKDVTNVPQLRELLAAHVSLSREEPGCLRFEAFESDSVAGTFILFEAWESQAALDLHRTATGFVTIYAPKVIPLIDRGVHVCKVLPGT